MNLSKKTISLVILIVGVFQSNFAQEENDLDTEVVTIVKPYSPAISDAFKVKETPVLNDSIYTQKKELNYSIHSVPVASTFTPAKGTATKLKKEKPIHLYDNYASLGFGNYFTILGEVFSNLQLSRTDDFGAYLQHHSSQGGIKNIVLDDGFMTNKIGLNYSSRQKEMAYQLKLDAGHSQYNWYGLPSLTSPIPATTINSIDPKQNYFNVSLGGSIALENSFIDKTTIALSYFGDSFSSSEINAWLIPSFKFLISDFNIKLDTEIDYLSGQFKQNYTTLDAINYSYLNLGISPSFVFLKEDFSATIGASTVLSLDLENNASKVFIFPNVNASYQLLNEQIIAYAGVDGGLTQNTYQNFTKQNPYVSPTLFIAPTAQLYNGFVGIKGKASNKIAYNIRASYSAEEDQTFYQINPYKESNTTYKGYEYGNSFQVVYSNVNTLSFFGELKTEVSNLFSLGLNATFSSYDPQNQTEAWNLPQLEASLFSDFKITKKVFAGASLFFAGERKELFQDNTFITVINLKPYLDANFQVVYKYNDRLSFFLKGNNLLANTYQKWYQYPVQGIQGLAGATYKFNW